jgi:hypothetical protein
LKTLSLHQLAVTRRQLVAKHPEVLDENLALRFATSYPSYHKAYVALQQCVVSRTAPTSCPCAGCGCHHGNNAQFCCRCCRPASPAGPDLLTAGCSQEWRRKEGMVGLLEQPEPAFETIKRLYPHAVLGWSRKKDCLVTVKKPAAAFLGPGLPLLSCLLQ